MARSLIVKAQRQALEEPLWEPDEAFQIVRRYSPSSAGGADPWNPREFDPLPPEGREVFTDLLNQVRTTFKFPAQ
eukprot:8449171-Pyramimonas_sp.AAC.1